MTLDSLQKLVARKRSLTGHLQCGPDLQREKQTYTFIITHYSLLSFLYIELKCYTLPFFSAKMYAINSMWL